MSTADSHHTNDATKVPPSDDAAAKLASHDAHEIAEKLRHDGSEAGYNKMLSTVADSKNHLKPTDLHHYREQLSTNLEKEKVLPQLSLSWTEHVLRSNKLDVHHTNTVNLGDINPFTKKETHDPLTVSMASAAERRLASHWENGVTVSANDLHGLIAKDSQLTVGLSNEKSNQKSAANNLEYLTTPRKELSNKSLIDAADLVGAKDQSEVDRKVRKEDFEALLKAPLVPVSDADRKFVQNMVSHWDSPEFAKLRDGNLITPESITALKKQTEVAGGSEGANPKNDADPKLKAESVQLSNKRTDLNGLSIFTAADIAGARGDKDKIDGKVGIEDLKALQNHPFVSLNKDTREQLTNLIKNWDKPEYANLRDGKYITTDSLAAANSGLTLDQQQHSSFLEKQIQELDAKSKQAEKLQEDTKKNAERLLVLRNINGIDFISAASKLGGGDSLSAGKEDFEQLLNEPLATIRPEDRKVISDLVKHWDDPSYVALRNSDDKITFKDVTRIAAPN